MAPRKKTTRKASTAKSSTPSLASLAQTSGSDLGDDSVLPLSERLDEGSTTETHSSPIDLLPGKNTEVTSGRETHSASLNVRDSRAVRRETQLAFNGTHIEGGNVAAGVLNHPKSGEARQNPFLKKLGMTVSAKRL